MTSCSEGGEVADLLELVVTRVFSCTLSGIPIINIRILIVVLVTNVYYEFVQRVK